MSQVRGAEVTPQSVIPHDFPDALEPRNRATRRRKRNARPRVLVRGARCPRPLSRPTIELSDLQDS